MSYAPGNGVPSRDSTSNLTLRTRPLCVLSYRDEETRNSKWYARPVTLRNPALIQCDAGYKAAGGRVLMPLFELRAREWRNAVDSHHTPRSGSPLFSKQVRLARPVDIPHWSAGKTDKYGVQNAKRTVIRILQSSFLILHLIGRRPGTCTRKARRF